MFRKIIIVLIAFGTVLAETQLENLQYFVRRNGVELLLTYSTPLEYDKIIVWKSNLKRIYLTLLDVESSVDKTPSVDFGGPISSIVLDDFDGSTQLSFMFKVPILGYEVVNIPTDAGSKLFIHLAESQDAFDALIAEKGIHDSQVGPAAIFQNFPEYGEAEFNAAFDRARADLGPNAFFQYRDRFYVTNHSGEFLDAPLAGFVSEQEKQMAKQPIPGSQKEVKKQDIPVLEIVKTEKLAPVRTSADWMDITVPEDVDLAETVVLKVEEEPSPPDPIMRNVVPKPAKIIQNNYEIKSSVSDDFSIVNEAGFQPSTDMPAHDPGVLPELIQWIDYETAEPLGDPDLEWMYPRELSVPPYQRAELNQKELDQKKWYQVQRRFLETVSAGIRVTSNMDGVPVYIDGKLIGRTPLKGAVKVDPGWHQVSGFTPVFAQVVAGGGLYEIGADPITRNNQLFGSKTVFVESGNVMVVNLKFNRINTVAPKILSQKTGGMMIGFPVIMALFGLITWGLM